MILDVVSDRLCFSSHTAGEDSSNQHVLSC